MTLDTVPRKPMAGPQELITAPAASSPRKEKSPSRSLSANEPAETEIRIHRDGLLIAKCRAIGLAPSRLFVAIDPLHYPVNSHLEIEFVNTGRGAASARLPATVISRSIKGIKLKFGPAIT